jgi:hypothetical protein
MGAFGHPEDIPQSGLVPGLPKWEYYFHGRGCCLTNRISGEAIDVDFYDDSADYFDLFFYLNYLKSLKDPEPVERHLIKLHPSFNSLALSFADLKDAGALVPFEDRSVCKLSDSIIEHEGLFGTFCDKWSQPENQLLLAARIGDWPTALELAHSNPEVSNQIEPLASGTKRERGSKLKLTFDTGQNARGALLALADLQDEGLSEILVRALNGPANGTASAALGLIKELGSAPFCPQIYKLFKRLQPDGPIPEPYVWRECLAIMLDANYRPEEMKRALSKAGGTEIGEAALFALERYLEAALTLFRRALRSRIPLCRCQAAAVMALIDQPWSRRELMAVLAESNDQEQTGECRAALLECHADEATQAVARWNAANPHEPETGPFITMAEMMLRNCASYVQSQMENLHDRVMKVRGLVPPDSPAKGKPWWAFWSK